MKDNSATIQGHFLVATHEMDDPRFDNSVILVCEHNDQGSVGIVVNKPSTHSIGEIFVDLNLATDCPAADESFFLGGPVNQNQGFVIHSSGNRWKATLNINDKLFMSSSLDVLEDLANDCGPSKYLVALGAAAWQSGQLEDELHRNLWLTVPASRTLLFNTPPERLYNAALSTLGMNSTNDVTPSSGKLQ